MCRNADMPVLGCTLATIHHLDNGLGRFDEMTNKQVVPDRQPDVIYDHAIVRAPCIGHKQDRSLTMRLGRDVDVLTFGRNPYSMKLRLDHDMWPFPDLPPAQHPSTSTCDLGRHIREAFVDHRVGIGLNC